MKDFRSMSIYIVPTCSRNTKRVDYCAFLGKNTRTLLILEVSNSFTRGQISWGRNRFNKDARKSRTKKYGKLDVQSELLSLCLSDTLLAKLTENKHF